MTPWVKVSLQDFWTLNSLTMDLHLNSGLTVRIWNCWTSYMIKIQTQKWKIFRWICILGIPCLESPLYCTYLAVKNKNFFFQDSKKCQKERAALWIHYKPSLFQHIGTHSSLKGKVQVLRGHWCLGKLVGTEVKPVLSTSFPEPDQCMPIKFCLIFCWLVWYF